MAQATSAQTLATTKAKPPSIRHEDSAGIFCYCFIFPGFNGRAAALPEYRSSNRAIRAKR
jgi:hypothetical protein